MAMKPLIETFQNEWELMKLVIAVDCHRPKKILEVGAWDGGTLWHWLGIADEVTVVDDRMRRQGDWFRWAQEADCELHLYQGMSQYQGVIADVEKHAPFDFLFIDGDHTYESVVQDWNNYSPMVADGGLVAFHDILPRPGYGVWKLWEELKSHKGSRWIEICQNEVLPGNEGRCGIGLIYL